ncbi:FtsX-like permease family protein [Streptomyces sp. BB1-1-1]|uniref:ABC transporter permease n=1 Tax=Streptomyces sp. BB1-1-1 TaxID=3074430 RepID=UPI002877F92B|nr:FtsX-like permease family protein [Streptomyces sp. BB1-1-1]WND32932.1 FtsX-like permease family protein [Streptomyces sp. BB1-1-1]
MIRIALSTLRFHKYGFIASFIALFLGATIVIGCGGLLETGVHNAAPPARLAAAPIVVTGDQRYIGTERELVFPERLRLKNELAEELQSVPGVATAVKDMSFPASLAHTPGTNLARTPGTKVTGHGWSSARLAPYSLSAGTAPTGSDRIVLGADLAERVGLRPGEHVQLATGGEARSFEISGLATGPDDGAHVFLSDAEAARASGHPGTTDSIGVFPAAGTDWQEIAERVRDKVVRQPAAGQWAAGQQITVLTGDDRGRAENPAVLADGSDLVPLAAAFGGLSAMVTIFVVSGTLGLSVQQRRREIALLRAIGATPGQLRRLILGETMVLSVLATALACLPGPAFGRWLLTAFSDAGAVPDAIVYRAGSVPLIVGAATTLLTAIGAALITAQGAVRTRPTEALAEAGLQRRWFSRFRLVVGLLCVAGGIALAMGTAASAGPDAAGVATPAAMVWAAGFGLLGPVLVRAVIAALRRPAERWLGLAGHLATRNAKARTTRLTAAALPVMLASGLALGLTYLRTTQSDGAKQAFDDSLRADLVVTSDSGGVPLSTIDAIRELPGVAAATAQIPSVGYLEPDEPMAGPSAPDEGASEGEQESAGPQPTELSLQGITPQGAAHTTAFRASSGDLDALHGDSVALPARAAEGHKIGDTVAMRLGDGSRVQLRLVATVDGERGYETALVPASLLVGRTNAGLVPTILVSAAPDTDIGRLSAELTKLTYRHPGLHLSDRATLRAVQAESDDTQAWMAYLVLGVVVGYSVISLLNTQIQATTERRREFMLQRLVGATRRQVLRMMTVEALMISLAGLLLGLLVAAATLVPLSLSILGSALPGGSPWILVTVIAATFALVLASTLLSTGVILRARPAADSSG